jgi:hypothetical protein
VSSLAEVMGQAGAGYADSNFSKRRRGQRREKIRTIKMPPFREWRRGFGGRAELAVDAPQGALVT